MLIAVRVIGPSQFEWAIVTDSSSPAEMAKAEWHGPYSDLLECQRDAYRADGRSIPDYLTQPHTVQEEMRQRAKAAAARRKPK